ncbi:caspase family protein [Streptomyces griseoviridis]
MNFYGLFVGIDHYESEFTGLRFAQRDATVLNALFKDNLEGRSTLLLDGEATKEKFVTEMRHLADASTDQDFVVIAFSGHGIPGGCPSHVRHPAGQLGGNILVTGRLGGTDP